MTAAPDPKTPRSGETFAQWYDRQGLRHFSAREFTRYFERTGNSYPPRRIWPNILPTMHVLDDLREELGVPILLTSTYRSPEYNRRVGGAARSQHMEFRAADIQATGTSPQRVFDTLKMFRSQGRFAGGLGRYNTFTHIDTRGRNATW